jgi:hypothetical protein
MAYTKRTECAMSQPLLAHLTLPHTLCALVDLVSLPSPTNATSQRRFRDPFLACELLRFGHASILDAFFVEGNALLERLVAAFRLDDPLDALVAEYVGRVLLKLCECRPKQTLHYIRTSGLLERFLVHLSNTSVLTLVLGVIASCTEEVEASQQVAASDLGNARLRRALDANAVTWFSEIRFPERLLRCVRANDINGLECAERLADLCVPPSVLLDQMCSGDVVSYLQLQMCSSPTVELARVVQFVFRVCNSQQLHNKLTPLLLPCVHTYTAFAISSNVSTNVLGAVRLECVRLWESVFSYGALSVCCTDVDVKKALTILANWFFQFPCANLYHVSFVKLVSTGLEKQPEAAATLLCVEDVCGRFIEYFRQHNNVWPRSPCLGEVVAVLKALKSCTFAFAFVGTYEASDVWAAVELCVQIESKPLAGIEVGVVKRNADFVSKADIDGIGETH